MFCLKNSTILNDGIELEKEGLFKFTADDWLKWKKSVQNIFVLFKLNIMS